MNGYEILLMIDVGKTIFMELLAEYKMAGQELTKEELDKASAVLLERRKAAVAVTKSH